MIRFGIVGFGLHAVKRLIPGFGPARNCRVSALSRRDLNRARETAAQYGIPHGFASAAELCSSPEVDAVFVASPDALHLRDVLTAIQCGKPVLCEKPMAMNPAECRQMVAAARAAGVLLGVAHVFRFEDSTARLRDRVAAGQVGRPVFARAEFCYSGRQHPRSWLTDPTLACGGPIADVGVHCIDALRYILQDEVVRVTARSLHDQGSGAVEAAASLTLEFLSGTLGTVMVSTRAEYRTPIEIVGESGVLRADDGLNVDRPISLQRWRNGAVVETEVVSNHLAYTHQVEAFAAAIEGKGIFPATGEEGWQNQEILDSAYRSTRSGVAEDVRRIKGLDL
jgi:1,5-anhydro-D-fructose reductase (1,5-anhydro-D-mannitol-forming)